MLSTRNEVAGQSANDVFCSPYHNGVIAQLVERYNGIVEVRGSNPRGSTPQKGSNHTDLSLFCARRCRMKA